MSKKEKEKEILKLKKEKREQRAICHLLWSFQNHQITDSQKQTLIQDSNSYFPPCSQLG